MLLISGTVSCSVAWQKKHEKRDDVKLVRVGFFCHGGGNRVPINGVKYLWNPPISLDSVVAEISYVGCK